MPILQDNEVFHKFKAAIVAESLSEDHFEDNHLSFKHFISHSQLKSRKIFSYKSIVPDELDVRSPNFFMCFSTAPLASQKTARYFNKKTNQSQDSPELLKVMRVTASLSRFYSKDKDGYTILTEESKKSVYTFTTCGVNGFRDTLVVRREAHIAVKKLGVKCEDKLCVDCLSLCDINPDGIDDLTQHTLIVSQDGIFNPGTHADRTLNYSIESNSVMSYDNDIELNLYFFQDGEHYTMFIKSDSLTCDEMINNIQNTVRDNVHSRSMELFTADFAHMAFTKEKNPNITAELEQEKWIPDSWKQPFKRLNEHLYSEKTPDVWLNLGREAILDIKQNLRLLSRNKTSQRDGTNHEKDGSRINIGHLDKFSHDRATEDFYCFATPNVTSEIFTNTIKSINFKKEPECYINETVLFGYGGSVISSIYTVVEQGYEDVKCSIRTTQAYQLDRICHQCLSPLDARYPGFPEVEDKEKLNFEDYFGASSNLEANSIILKGNQTRNTILNHPGIIQQDGTISRSRPMLLSKPTVIKPPHCKDPMTILVLRAPYFKTKRLDHFLNSMPNTQLELHGSSEIYLGHEKFMQRQLFTQGDDSHLQDMGYLEKPFSLPSEPEEMVHLVDQTFGFGISMDPLR